MIPQNRRALVRLRRALSGLPAPWIVIGSRRASDDGPPWVRFLALHPEKGIALLDVAPARPDLAIAPLEEFLARTGLSAFADGDPPIVAVALDLSDLSAIDNRLAEAFADQATCKIENADWPEALAELLMTTPDLVLARLGHPPHGIASPSRGDGRQAASHAQAAEDTAPQHAPADTVDATAEIGSTRWRRTAMASIAVIARCLAAAYAVIGWTFARSRHAAGGAASSIRALATSSVRLFAAAGRAVATAFLATIAASVTTVGAAAIVARRIGARAIAHLSAIALVSIQRSWSAAGKLVRASGAMVAASRASSPRIVSVAKRATSVAKCGLATLIGAATRQAREFTTAASTMMSGSRGVFHSAATALTRAVAVTRQESLRRLPSWFKARQPNAPSIVTACLALAAVSLGAFGWLAVLVPPRATPPSEASAAEPAAASIADAAASALPLTASGSGAADQVSFATFDLGGVALRFDPPPGYCLYSGPLLQSVVAQQDRINTENVVHAVFGDCDQMRQIEATPGRISDYGLLMTPREPGVEPIDEPAFRRIVASAADPRTVKKTLAQRLREAQGRLKLQSVSSLGVLQRSRDATYFAYLFKTGGDDGGYTQACVMALTAVKGRLVAYYLYSDYKHDARATLTGLLRKARANMNALEAQNG